MMLHTRRAGAAVLAVGCVMLAGCGPEAAAPVATQTTPDASHSLYLETFEVAPTNLTEFLAKTDLVVTGRIQPNPRSVLESDITTATGELHDPPMLVYRVEVTDVLRGQRPETLEVGQYDTSQIVYDEQQPVPVDTDVLLFLRAGPKGVYGVAATSGGIVAVNADGSLEWQTPDASAFPGDLAALQADLEARDS